jgi:hypothetical protein
VPYDSNRKTIETKKKEKEVDTRARIPGEPRGSGNPQRPSETVSEESEDP